MSVLLSFWKPVHLFDSSFNKFAAWLTHGEFCHVEVVLHVPSDVLKASITKAIAMKSQEKNNAIDEAFFHDPVSRQQLASSNHMFVSFSALWGMKLSARILRNTATNAWEHTPMESHEDVEFIKLDAIEDEKLQSVCDFCVGKLGESYNTIGALFSASGADCAFLKTPHSLFCSEMAVKAMQITGTFVDVKAAATTPNSLYKMLKAKQAVKIDLETDSEDETELA